MSEDFELMLLGASSTTRFADLGALVTIMNANGVETLAKTEHIVTLRPVLDFRYCRLCSDLMILAHARRHGLVEGNNSREVLDNAGAQSDTSSIGSFSTVPS